MALLADYNLPFAIALAIMVLLALGQALGLGGFEIDAESEIDLDANASLGPIDGLLSFVGIGRLPFTIWLALFLLLFAALGVSVQMLAGALTGGPLNLLLASAVAAIGALPVTGALSRPISAILPKDETSAVSTDTLLGRRARMGTGRACVGYPAKAVVFDHYGQMHNVMVEPHEAGAHFVEGDEVLLVRRTGETFFAVAVHDRRLAPTD